MKGGKALTYILVSLSILVVLLLVIFFLNYSYFMDIISGEKSGPRINPFKAPTAQNEGQPPSPETPSTEETPPAAAGGGGGGGGGGGSSGGEESPPSPPTNPNCHEEKISYALRRFSKSIVCNQYSGPDCIDLTAECSVEVQNLDPSIAGGDFTLRIDLVDSLDQRLDTIDVTHYLSYNEIKEFFNEFRITDPLGIEETLNCDMKTIQVPTKTIC